MRSTSSFLWDPRDDVAEVLRFGHTSAVDYGRKMLSAEKWKDPQRPDHAVALARSSLRRGFRRAERDFAPWLFACRFPGSMPACM
ncbi:MAG: hypothetical protein HPM95_04880 [Alphaproteobacteria bacterium]|nr:hypothetical protein [Alphaproteobacteria bacterium]